MTTRGVRMTVGVIVVVLLSSACQTEGPSSADVQVEDAAADACEQFDSYSGRVMVGDPLPSPTEPLQLVEPGQEPPPGPAWPRLQSVELDPSPDADVVVFELVGDGTIGWTARFVQSPRLQQTDEAVEIAGACVLQIDLSGVDRAPDASAEPRPERLSSGDGSTIVEVFRYPVVESIAQAFVGIRTPTPTVSIETEDRADRSRLVLTIAA